MTALRSSADVQERVNARLQELERAAAASVQGNCHNSSVHGHACNLKSSCHNTFNHGQGCGVKSKKKLLLPGHRIWHSWVH